MTSNAIHSNEVVESVARSRGDHQRVIARFLPQLKQLTDCAIYQLAQIIDPNDASIEPFVRECIRRKYYPRVRLDSALAETMDSLRESGARAARIDGAWNALQGISVETEGAPHLEEMARKL